MILILKKIHSSITIIKNIVNNILKAIHAFENKYNFFLYNLIFFSGV